MRFSLTTWNINSVRLRIDIVAKFLKSARPDVLCLQETKCPDDRFPLKRFKRLGYEHVALKTERLSRRRRAFAPAVRKLQHPVLLRQGRLSAHLGRARRARGAARSDHAA